MPPSPADGSAQLSPSPPKAEPGPTSTSFQTTAGLRRALHKTCRFIDQNALSQLAAYNHIFYK